MGPLRDMGQTVEAAGVCMANHHSLLLVGNDSPFFETCGQAIMIWTTDGAIESDWEGR